MPPWKIEIHASSFRSGAKDAAKRHRSFKKELSDLFKSIEKDPVSVGDPITSSNPDHVVRKVRIGCPGENVQPRAGYRLIYQLLEVDGKSIVRCLDLYYKKKQSTVRKDEVGRLVDLAAAAEMPADSQVNSESEPE